MSAMSAGRRWRFDHVEPVRYRVLHETRYDYGSAVSLSQQQLHLSPRILDWQQVEEQRIDIEPVPTWRRDGRDAFGNPVTWMAFHAPHEMLFIRSVMVVAVTPHRPKVLADSLPWEKLCATAWPTTRPIPCRKIWTRRASCSKARTSASSTSWPTMPPTVSRPGRPVLVGAQALMAKIFREFTFDPGSDHRVDAGARSA